MHVILDILGYADIIREYFKDEYIEIIELNDESEIVDAITKYIKRHDSIKNYVVVDSKSVKDMQVHFPLHCIYVNDGMDDLFYKQIVRKFVYGNGWEKDYMYSELEEIDDNFENVIFLDIDGVLNRDHNIHKEDKTLIVDEFVENLVSIVKQTKAEIVLSSSWRGNIDRIGDDFLFEEKHHDAKVLFTYLSKYNLCLAGATPIIGSGSDSRPLEIRTWLKKRSSVRNFVILDDDTFWSWRELSDYVVTTSYEEKEKYKDEIWHDVRHAGLEEKYISEAVDILKKSSEMSEIAQCV